MDALLTKAVMNGPLKMVCGFAKFQGSLVMIKKLRGPRSVKGRLNGIGGKVEEGESIHQAMAREFLEEAGVVTNVEDWHHEIDLVGADKSWEVAFFRYAGAPLSQPVQMTDEKICYVAPMELWLSRISDGSEVVKNLRWIVPLCFDTNISKPLSFVDHS